MSAWIIAEDIGNELARFAARILSCNVSLGRTSKDTCYTIKSRKQAVESFPQAEEQKT